MSKREIILHTFQWRFKDITANIQKIKDCGYTAVQITPVQGFKDDGYEFWKAYQPLDIGFVESKQLGVLSEYNQMIEACHEAGVKVVQDVVLRHVAGKDNGELKPHEKVVPFIRDNPDFFTNTENLNDENNRLQLTTFQTGLPMLDYLHEGVIFKIFSFLSWLKLHKVDAIRLDQAKHYLLKSEGGGSFFERLFSGFDSNLSYGETLDTDVNVLNEIAQTCKILTWSNLKDSKQKVLAVETHDEYWTWECSRGMTDNDIVYRWDKLLLENPDNNVLFFCRPFNNTWKDERIKRINRRN